MAATLQKINTTIVKPKTTKGRALEQFDGRLNPSRFITVDNCHIVVMTKFADGELLFETSDMSGTSGGRCSTTEAECGLTYMEIIELHDSVSTRGMRVVDVAGVQHLVLGPTANKQFVGLRALVVLEAADPLDAVLKRMAIQTRVKTSRSGPGRGLHNILAEMEAE